MRAKNGRDKAFFKDMFLTTKYFVGKLRSKFINVAHFISFVTKSSDSAFFLFLTHTILFNS